MLALGLLVGSAVAAAPYAFGDAGSATLPMMLLGLLGLTLQGFTLSGVFVLAFFMYRHDAAVAAALQRAELERIALRKKTLESGLQLMQARVEPQFLLETLRGIGVLYETDRFGAERMLDNLIRYLRAALPQMRSTESTLGREVGLAEAYLNIADIRGGGRLDFGFAVPDELHGAAFPPMVLLPLIERLALRGAKTSGESTTLRVEGRSNGQMLAIEVTCSGPAAGESVDDLRDRLVALYSDRTRLVVERRGAHETLATLVVPQLAGDGRAGFVPRFS
jgi:LytS/YehU family sensor histidine kinase